MSVRSVPVGDVIVNGAGAPQSGVVVTATLLVPGTALALDSNGDVIDLTPLTATTDNTGTYLFDPTATPTNGLIAPGDIYQRSGGSLVALGGCAWQITYLSTTIISPNFAYSASELHPSAWVPSLPTLGLLKMDLTDILGSGATIQGAGFAIAISQSAIWTGGAGAGQRVDGSFALSTNASGQIFTYLIRSAELNPSGTPYTLAASTPGGQPGVWTFTCPTLYTQDKGVYAGGTTYALNDVVRRAADDVPFISLTNGNTGNALTDGTHWAIYAGEKITANLIPAGPPGQISYNTTILAHDANVAVLPDDPVQSPATLSDDLHNLAVRTGHALRTLTGTTTLDHATDDWIIADAGTAAFTVNLPNATARVREYFIIRKNSGANGVTIAAAGGQTINGLSTQTLTAQFQWAILRSDGVSAWYMQTGTAGGGTPTFSYTVKTANYTVTTADSGLDVDASGGNVTITLLSAAGVAQQFAVKRRDDTSSGHTVTVATSGGQTIDGQSTLTLAAQNQEYVVASDGTNWRIFASYYPNPLTTEGDIPYWHSGALSRLTLGSTLAIAAGVLNVNFGNQAAATFLRGPFIPAGPGATFFGAITAADLPIATTASLGVVEPDGTTLVITSGGVLSAASSGSTLASLGDANISGADDLDVLIFRSSDSKWHNVDPTDSGSIRWEPVSDSGGNLLFDANGGIVVAPVAN